MHMPHTSALLLPRFIANHKDLADWLFAAGIGLGGIPFSFLFWHRNLYKAAITNGTMR